MIPGVERSVCVASSEVVKTVTMKSGFGRFAESVVDVGFIGIAALCGLLFFTEEQRWPVLSAPLKALILAAWCPFFWGKYWMAKSDGRRSAWFVFGCAALSSAVAILAAVIVMIRLIR